VRKGTLWYIKYFTHLKGVVGSKADQDTAQQLGESENSALSLQTVTQPEFYVYFCTFIAFATLRSFSQMHGVQENCVLSDISSHYSENVYVAFSGRMGIIIRAIFFISFKIFSLQI
jgi:hypothetical protein